MSDWSSMSNSRSVHVCLFTCCTSGQPIPYAFVIRPWFYHITSVFCQCQVERVEINYQTASRMIWQFVRTQSRPNGCGTTVEHIAKCVYV